MVYYECCFFARCEDDIDVTLESVFGNPSKTFSVSQNYVLYRGMFLFLGGDLTL